MRRRRLPEVCDAARPVATARGAPRPGLRGGLRAALRLIGFAAGLVVATPVQLVALATGWPARGLAPMGFHRYACMLFGVERKLKGAPARGGVLLVANHSSWLDILVLGGCSPAAFAARADLATWPVLGLLARLQRTMFVDRARRGRVGADAAAIATRLAQGDDVALFAEGTTSDGASILPFRSALLAAGDCARAIQPVLIVYVARDGAPLDDEGRADVAWNGDKALWPHVWSMLARRRLVAHIEFCDPVAQPFEGGRKALAARLEEELRERLDNVLGR